MEKIAAAIICLGFVGVNAFLIVNEKEAIGWLWFGAILAFISAF